MTSEFEKEFLPEWCENCDQQGVYFVDDVCKPYLVVCQHCGREVLSAWCPECGAGFALPNKDGSRELNWTCPLCQVEYPLSVTVYAQPVRLYLESDLPEAVRARVIPPRRSLSVAVVVLIAIAIVAIGFLAFWLLR